MSKEPPDPNNYVNQLRAEQPTAGESKDKIGNVCDDCGKHIDTSLEGIVTESGELLCMDCQESEQQPKAGDFTRKLREDYDPKDVPIAYKNACEDITDLCDRLDRAETRLKAMYAGDLSPESRLSGYKVIVNELRKEKAETINADLLEAWEIYKKRIITGYGKTFWQTNCLDIEAAIAKAKRDR